MNTKMSAVTSAAIPQRATQPAKKGIRHKLSNDESFEVLKGLDLFTALPDSELKRVAAYSRTRSVAKGETVFRQDDPAGEYLYILAEGEITLSMESLDGRESIVSLLKQGDFLGDICLWDGGEYPATALANVSSCLICLRKEDVFQCLKEYPEFGLGVLRELSLRLRNSLQRVTHLAHQRVEKRLASLFLQLFEERGIRLRDESGRRCVILQNRPKQLDLAEMAGTSRETVSRLMTAWEKAGWIRDEHSRDVFLLDEAALRRRLE